MQSSYLTMEVSLYLELGLESKYENCEHIQCKLSASCTYIYQICIVYTGMQTLHKCILVKFQTFYIIISLVLLYIVAVAVHNTIASIQNGVVHVYIVHARIIQVV